MVTLISHAWVRRIAQYAILAQVSCAELVSRLGMVKVMNDLWRRISPLRALEIALNVSRANYYGFGYGYIYEMEIVRKNKKWMCPHCIEAKGINPYWICNSYVDGYLEAREKGFKSVAHLLMEKLKEEAVKKRKL
ncbi:hypothetical protein ACLOJK_023684 [Asimina triloba]